uniref:YcxB family protein n=1 Tax=Altererythrobacter segetis TaxID=1104773 RepID=UPI0014081FA5|nr:YcxB family protein [Altererythrobacter segetis]
MGEFTVTMREEDLYRGFLLNATNRNARPVMLAALVVLMLLVVLLLSSPAARYSLICNALTLMLLGAVFLAAFLLALVLFVRKPILRSMARRTLAQRRDLATPVAWSFDDGTLRIATRFTRSEFPWDALRRWREDDRVLLVYLADQLFHAVPKDQVDEAHITALRTALESHGVPRR